MSNWSKIIEEHGVRIRLYTRSRGGNIYREIRLEDGSKDRKSLGHADRERAEEQAKALAEELATLRLTGGPKGDLTLGRLGKLYLYHRGPLLSDSRERFMTTTLELFERYFGEEYRIGDFDQHEADAYATARAEGELLVDDFRATDSPAAGTIRNELSALSTVCNWACRFRHGGRPLLGFNPLRGLDFPREENPARPIVTPDRYRALLSVAEEADAKGRLRCLLVLAWETGRRINAMCHLRASDVLLSEDALRRALAEDGQDEALADFWSHALRWRAEWDKCGYLDFSPLSDAAREALEAYMTRRPVVGEAWVFPANEDVTRPLDKQMAYYYLRKAEKLAGVAKQKQGGFHAFRRAWATRRRHLPAQDVARAGGWRDVKALQKAYQAADPETVRRVVELG